MSIEKNLLGITSESRLRVRYAETDQMGIVYHSNHVIYLEVGRVDFMRQLGFAYKDMEREDDCFTAIVDLHIRYKAPAFYDDELIVRTCVINVRESLLHFGYEVIRAADGKLVAEAETVHVITDKNMKKRSLPEKYSKALHAAMAKKAAKELSAQ